MVKPSLEGVKIKPSQSLLANSLLLTCATMQFSAKACLILSVFARIAKMTYFFLLPSLD